MKKLSLLVILLFYVLRCNAQSGNIADRLQAYFTQFIPEKVYLQFDKPYYAAGDTMYFKAYLVKGERHELSNISGVLHVDLINPQNEIYQSIKLESGSGTASGDFSLADTLPAGNYRVRSWTRWMRNDPSSFFDKVISVGSLQNRKITENATLKKRVKSLPDLQFFPEGGTLVAGIQSRIAFKATEPNGLGIMVKGIVVDNENKTICNFKSEHLGMGSFDLTPQLGKSYKAKLVYANGFKNTIPLPSAEDKGITMSINNDSIAVASITINANQAYYKENQDKDYRLLVYSAGTIDIVRFKLDSASMHMAIIKRHLFTGISTVTLFAGTNEPLCERLFFVQKYDQLNLITKTDKKVYQTRERVHVNLHALTRTNEPSEGSFSASVTDEDKIPDNQDDESTILSYLLCTSDLKGYVEQPNYYFTNTSKKTVSDLDLVMMTNGYRRFEWKKLLSDQHPKSLYQPEMGLEISGQATNLSGKPLVNGTVSLIQMQGPFFSQKTDSSGNFVFKNLIFSDTGHFVLQAVDARNRKQTKLIYKNDLPEPTDKFKVATADTAMQMRTYLVNAEKRREQLNILGLGKSRTLTGITIRSKKSNDKYFTFSFAGAGNADQVMHAEEIERVEGPLITSLDGRLRGVIFRKANNDIGLKPWLAGGLSTGPMLVIIDGVEGADLSSMTASDVETVEVLKGYSASIYGMQGGNGVLIVTTKQGGGLSEKDISSIGVLPITVNGFYKAREFYSPRYVVKTNNIQADLRTTIFWKPDIQTDKNGDASFDYYNADGKGTYKVTIEGIDKNGNIGRQVYRYSVN